MLPAVRASFRAAFDAHADAVQRAAVYRDEYAWLKPREGTVRRCADLERKIDFADKEAWKALARMRGMCKAMYCALDAEDQRWARVWVKRYRQKMARSRQKEMAA